MYLVNCYFIDVTGLVDIYLHNSLNKFAPINYSHNTIYFNEETEEEEDLSYLNVDMSSPFSYRNEEYKNIYLDTFLVKHFKILNKLFHD